MEIWQILALLGGILLFVGILVFVTRTRRQRAEAIREWGGRTGWTLESDGHVGDRFRTHLFTGRRRRGKCRNVLTLSGRGEELILFDYEYLRNSGSTTHHVRQTVLAARREHGAPPPFELRPERLFDKVASALGRGDINFEHRPDFSRRYLLRADDEAAIRKLFDATRLRFFEQNEGWSVECDGEWLLTYRGRNERSAEELDRFLEECRHIGELLRPPRQ